MGALSLYLLAFGASFTFTVFGVLNLSFGVPTDQLFKTAVGIGVCAMSALFFGLCAAKQFNNTF